MGLQVGAELSDALDALDGEFRLAAEAIGASVVPKLLELRPRVAAPTAEPSRLESLHLEGEGEPDGLMLAACVAAHAAYVNRSGQAEGVSVGALAIARLLVWAQRAAMIGRPLAVRWIGPPARQPEGMDETHAVLARCRVSTAGSALRAEAVALVAAEG